MARQKFEVGQKVYVCRWGRNWDAGVVISPEVKGGGGPYVEVIIDARTWDGKPCQSVRKVINTRRHILGETEYQELQARYKTKKEQVDTWLKDTFGATWSKLPDEERANRFERLVQERKERFLEHARELQRMMAAGADDSEIADYLTAHFRER